jgi:hypothetical protein
VWKYYHDKRQQAQTGCKMELELEGQEGNSCAQLDNLERMVYEVAFSGDAEQLYHVLRVGDSAQTLLALLAQVLGSQLPFLAGCVLAMSSLAAMPPVLSTLMMLSHVLGASAVVLFCAVFADPEQHLQAVSISQP